LNKVISQPLAKKIYDKAKEKGFELPESERYRNYQGSITKNRCGSSHNGGQICTSDIVQYYPAFDCAELGEMLPEMIDFRKDKYFLEIKDNWIVDYYFDSYPSCGGILEICKELDIKNIPSENLAEAMGKMFYYLLDNDLIS
jgi:hypothetical protein